MTADDPRPDPYTLVFGAESMDERLFPPIAEEAEARDQPLDDPDRFLFLSSVGKLLQAIGGTEPYAGQPEPGPEPAEFGEPVEPVEPAEFGEPGEPGEVGEPVEAAGPAGAGGTGEPAAGSSPDRKEALRQYGRLLYHAFHFWRGRKHRAALDEEKVRWLIDDVTTVGDWSLRPPAGSGYLRLPRNLIWAAPAPGLQPEPVDGLFWMLAEPDDEPARLHVLLTLGVRPDRPGFSVVPATGILDDEAHWAELDARPDGTDFETTLPGGEMDELYSIETAAEVLKLASRAFWALDPASG